MGRGMKGAEAWVRGVGVEQNVNQHCSPFVPVECMRRAGVALAGGYSPHAPHLAHTAPPRLLNPYALSPRNFSPALPQVYYKRGDTPPLQPYKQQLQELRERLSGLDCPHVWPMQVRVRACAFVYGVA